MSDCEFENKVQTLKVELMAGQTNQAAALLRDELYCHPQEAMALINRARMPNTPDEIVITGNGTVMVRDHLNRFDQVAGQLPCEQSYGPYAPQQQYGPYRPAQPQPCEPVQPPCWPTPQPRYEPQRPQWNNSGFDITFGASASAGFDFSAVFGDNHHHRRRR